MVSTYRFPYPDDSTKEVVVVAYSHMDKHYLQSHKHVVAEDGSHRIPAGLHTEDDKDFMTKCQIEVETKLNESGLKIEC